MNHLLRTAATGLILFTCLVAAIPRAAAQAATPVPKLDPDRLIGTYYEIARYPTRREKPCLGNEMVLYALGDKRNALQIVTTCQVKNANSDFWNSKGKFDLAGDGRLKLSWIWPFTQKYWVLAIAPDYSWALAGNPNHRSLWVLSRTSALSPEVLADIESKATAQGFNAPRLIQIPQP
jgi:apolipoprotein D and lipocalin family protein